VSVRTTPPGITSENDDGRFMSRPRDRDTMPAISISDDQRERLRWIQRRLGDDVEYGHVRPRDALEYLLDRFDEADDEPAASDAATPATESAGGSVPEHDRDDPPETASGTGSAFGETDGFAVVNGGGISVVEGTSVLGETTDGAADGNDGTAEADGDDHDAESDGDAEQADDGTDATTTDGPADGTDDTDGDGSADADDEARLNSVMSLLEDHDDRWSEASGGEEKYAVDLPDGTTERARTKDDVRALLFKHYR
jgi:hypothetical protein